MTGIDSDDLIVETSFNGILNQKGSTRDFIYSVSKAISFFTEFMALEPGDIILTGAFKSIENTHSVHGDDENSIKVSLHAGDTIDVAIEQVGILKNTLSKA